LALCFLFWLRFVLLLFILTSCHYGLMMLKVEGLEGHFFIAWRKWAREDWSVVGEAQWR
jgi:hypothetical protein